MVLPAAGLMRRDSFRCKDIFRDCNVHQLPGNVRTAGPGPPRKRGGRVGQFVDCVEQRQSPTAPKRIGRQVKIDCRHASISITTCLSPLSCDAFYHIKATEKVVAAYCVLL